MSLTKIITAYPYAIAEVISLEDMKLYLRVSGADEDDLIEELVAQATKFAEGETNQQFSECQYEWRMDAWPAGALQIPRGPLISVDSIDYVDGDGVEQALGEAVYEVDTYDPAGRIALAAGQSWPTLNQQLNAVTITYTAGYADDAEELNLVRGLIRLLVGHWYRNREAVLTGTISKEIELAVSRIKWLLKNY